jgi:predicted membrane channel-forming protein YqfA (hemolysin III family)
LDYLIKYQKEIFRILGVLLFIVGFGLYFWTIPQKAVSQSELAAANVARMEASVQGKSTQKAKKRADPSHIAKALKQTRAQQMHYITLFAMIVGALFLLLSFLKPKKEG